MDLRKINQDFKDHFKQQKYDEMFNNLLKGEEPMAKATKETKTEVEATVEKVTNKTFANSALSIVYNGNKRYSVVSVPFEGTVAGTPKVIEDNLDLYEAQHVFKVQTVKAGLFDEGQDNT